MAKTFPSQGTGMAKSLPSQRFWDTIEMLRITKGENIAENDTKLPIFLAISVFEIPYYWLNFL